MPKLDEINLPIVNVPSVGVAGAQETAPTTMPAYDEPEVVDYEDVEAEDTFDGSRITVWADSVKPAGGYEGDRALFDVVLSVGVTCEDGSSKTYSIIKRIAFDKKTLLKQAEVGGPVSVVESKGMSKDDRRRLRILAGLE